MNFAVRWLLAIYRLAVNSGLMQTRFGRALFLFAYRIYKRIEHRHIHSLAQYVRPGTWIIDVGANVGFLTCLFAGWLRDGGRIIAIEPEDANFAELRRAVTQSGRSEQATLIQAVASDKPGEMLLTLDPYHPANHHIGTSGVPIKAVTLDGLTIEQNSPPVSLVKIDVQGADLLTLRGASGLMQRDHPVLVVEVSDGLLHDFGGDARQLFEFVTGFGYQIHQLENNGLSAPLSKDQALTLATTSDYDDFIFVYPAR